MKVTPDRVCEFIAARQFGIITRAQAIESGLTDRAVGRRLASGRWIPIHTSVYFVGRSANTWERNAMAALLASGPGAALSHLTAAALHGYRKERPLRIDVTTSRRLRTRGVLIHRSPLGPRDIGRIGPMTVTSPARTLVDLAGILDEQRLEECVEEVLHRGDTTSEELEQQLVGMGSRGRRGAGILRRLLEVRNPGWAPTESQLETLLVRVLRGAGLPLPDRQVDVFDDRGFVTRLDFAYPEALLAIPADSYQWHGRRQVWEQDIDQRNRLLALRWRVRPTTWGELNHRPHQFTSDVEHLLNDLWH